MKIHWTADYDMVGNGYGYSTHNKNMRAALERCGVEFREDADLAVHITTPPSFEPVEGKYNVLFTMYEAATLPEEWPERMKGADLLVVPCTWNRQLFSKYYKGPIEVVPEGYKPEKFELTRREFPKDSKFMFLWVGASNPRKGYEHVLLAWQQWLKRYPETLHKVHLYMKTTQSLRAERVVDVSRCDVTVDIRDWEFSELTELYKMAHCFLFPSMGEGWGLTLMEAMGTGMPCIYTPWSAMTDWVPKKHAYPLKFNMKQIDTVKQVGEDRGKVYHHSKAASPDIDDLVRKMYRVYTHYEEAAHKGYYAGKAIQHMTWDRAGRIFLEKVLPHYEAAA